MVKKPVRAAPTTLKMVQPIRPSKTPGWTALSTGLVSLAVGSYFIWSWQDHLSRATTGQDACNHRQGPECYEAGGTLGVEGLLGTASTHQVVGLVVAGVGLAATITGIVLLTRQANPTRVGQAPTLTLHPIISPYAVGIGGRF